jgi:hypothetical protein
MTLPPFLNDLDSIVIKLGVVALTVLFIVRACLNEIRNMKNRKP